MSKTWNIEVEPENVRKMEKSNMALPPVVVSEKKKKNFKGKV